MGHGRGKSGTYHEPIPPPVNKYTVSGELDPDFAGDYFYAGIYEGKRYYALEIEAAYLWETLAGVCQITIEPPGTPYANAWVKNSPGLAGEYLPIGECLGIATVSE